MADDPIPLKLAHPGGRRVKGQRQADGARYGNSRAYLEARLTRDAEEGCREAATLLQAVRDGRITHYAAAVEMNYTKRAPLRGRVEWPNVTKRNDWAMHKVLHPRPDPKSLVG
jgi:hypothetical protein